MLLRGQRLASNLPETKPLMATRSTTRPSLVWVIDLDRYGVTRGAAEVHAAPALEVVGGHHRRSAAVTARARAAASPELGCSRTSSQNDPDPKLLAYQYLQTLPQLAQSSGNTFWVIPSEVTTALRSITRAFGEDERQASTPDAKGITPPPDRPTTAGS
jgi:hypothetical protein